MAKTPSFYVILFCIVISSACITAPKSNSGSPVISAQWVKSTLPEDYFQQRLAHRMTPVLYNDWLIQGNGIDNISAYDQKTGELQWKLLIPGGVEGGAAIEKDMVYFGANDGVFYAVHANTGKIKWTSPVGAQALAAPSIADEKIFFLTGNNVVQAIKKTDGSKLWNYNRQTSSYFSVRSAATPLVIKNTLYVGTADGYLVALNALNGSLLWERQLNTNKKFKDVDATPIIDGEKLYISSFDGSLYCLDLVSGKTIWKFDEGGYLPPTIIGQVLYYPTTTRKLVALDKTNGNEMWKMENLTGVATQPRLWRQWLTIGESEGKIKLIEPKTGKLAASFSPGRGLISTPILSESTQNIYFISNEGNLFALRIDNSNI